MQRALGLARASVAVAGLCVLSACGGGGDAVVVQASASEAPSASSTSGASPPTVDPTNAATGQASTAAPSAANSPAPSATASSGAAASAGEPTVPATALITWRIQGFVTYDAVPRSGTTGALRYALTHPKPVRGAVVELLDEQGLSLSTTQTSAEGAYQFQVLLAPSGPAKPWRVRVRAETKALRYQYSVHDNTAGDALYGLTSSPFVPSAEQANTVSLHAASGWTTLGYAAPRAAAPFAILDVAYQTQQILSRVAPDASLPALKLMWSPNNRPAAGDTAVGEIGSSRFFLDAQDKPQVLLLGLSDVDTDEYDASVIAHELGHFMHFALSRNDSPGGAHHVDDRIDMRGAFSEGLANAWSGLVVDDTTYSDSNGWQQGSGFVFNSAQAPRAEVRGWFNEGSVQHLVWEARFALGLETVVQALMDLRRSPALSSVFSFVDALQRRRPESAEWLRRMALSVGVDGRGPLGEGESHDGGVPGVLPIYVRHTVELGQAQTYCLHTRDGVVNRLGNHVFVRLGVVSAGARRFSLSPTGPSAGTTAPSIMVLPNGGVPLWSRLQANQSARLDLSLPAGEHVLTLSDYALQQPKQTQCFDLRVD